MFLSKCCRLAIVLAVVGLMASSAHAAFGAIAWYNNTNYTFAFGTNSVTNLVSIAVEYPGFGGLEDDGGIWETSAYYAQSIPAGLTNIGSLASSSWYLDEPFTLAVRSDGRVFQWGPSRTTATPPPGLSNVIAVAAGLRHSVALKADGTVTTWGFNYYGGTNLPPGLSNVVAISAGARHTLALKNDGTVVAWGNNDFQQTNVPSGLSNIVGIAGGSDHSLALGSDGRLVAWGAYRPFYSNIVAGVSNVAIIAAGWGDVAVRKDGTLAAWGNTASSGPAVQPTPALATNVVSISCGYRNAALLGEGLPRMPAYPMRLTVPVGLPLALPAMPGGHRSLNTQWRLDGNTLADQTSGTLFLSSVSFSNAGIYSAIVSNWFGTVTNVYLIQVAAFLITFPPQSQVAYGGDTVQFNVGAFGENLSFQWRFNGTTLPGATNSELTLTNVTPNHSGAYSVTVSNAAGTRTLTATLDVTGALRFVSSPQSQSTFVGASVFLSAAAQGVMPLSYQWRLNGVELPGETRSSLTLTNVQISQSGGYSVTIANPLTNVVADASLMVSQVANWNYQQGQMANIPGLTNLVSLAAGGYHNLALRWDGTVLAWGLDTGNGELSVPEQATNVVAIAAGEKKSLALRGDGTVLAWGSNAYGENAVPATATNVVAIASGDIASLALRADGTVVGWGATTVPANATNIVAVAAGSIHALALRADGTVLAWGENPYGQTLVPGSLSNVVAIAAGGYESLALTSDGSIHNWGQSLGGLGRPADGTIFANLGVGFETAYALGADGQVQGLGGSVGIPENLRNVTELKVGRSQALALVGDEPPMMRVAPAAAMISAEGFKLLIPSQCGRVYRLEYMDSLTETNWKAFPLVAGNGGSVTLRDPGPQSATQRFYRVRRW